MNNFEATYKEYFQVMFCVARKMIHDKDAAYDIVQDVFVYYIQKSQDGYTIRHTKGWLIKATINKCIDYTNHDKRFSKVETLNHNLIKESTPEKHPDTEMIKLALARLKPKEKTLVLLYSEGFSYKEISVIAEIKFSSVGKMLSRTLKKLNGILKQSNYEMY